MPWSHGRGTRCLCKRALAHLDIRVTGLLGSPMTNVRVTQMEWVQPAAKPRMWFRVELMNGYWTLLEVTFSRN